MIKINDSNKKAFYYVSNVKAGTVTIIDGGSNSIIKNIFVGMRPFNIAVMNNNKICVACDRSDSILVIDCLSHDTSKIDIPNDGNIEVDRLNEKMFISNTSEVIIVDIATEKIISNITGLLAITALKLSIDSSKLYVLDKLLSEFRIYSTANFNLIYTIKDLGANPGCFLISKDDKIAYITIESNEKSSNSNNILKLDIHKKKIKILDLPKNSVIAGMLINRNILYAANKGLNRIELINIDSDKAYGFILTSMPKPNRLCITDDETKILVVNRNDGGKGSLDIIDTGTNTLITSVLMDSYNSQSYDVVSISVSPPEISSIPVVITDLNATNKILIIIKKVFQCHHENIDFQSISVVLSEQNNLAYVLEEIKFEDGVIVKGSESRTDIDEMPGFSRIQFALRITYTVHYLKNNEDRCGFKGFLEFKEDIIMAIPKGRNVNEFELKLKTRTNLINTPLLIDNVVRFGATVSLEIKIIGEDEISIPALQQSFKSKSFEESLDNDEEYFETFLGFKGSIFPEGTVFPYLNGLDD